VAVARCRRWVCGKISIFVLGLLFRAFSGADEAGWRRNDAVARGGGAHFVSDGRLVFKIGVIIDDSGVTVAWRQAACRRAPPHPADRRWVKSLGFEFPQSVAFDGKPGENEQAGHDQAKTDNEAGEGTWVLGSISR
jgi:hypothetical protein